MESGRIANEQISASSMYSDGRWTPQQSRLHGDDNGWTPNLDSSKEYLQVLTQRLFRVCVLRWVRQLAPSLESTKDMKKISIT